MTSQQPARFGVWVLLPGSMEEIFVLNVGYRRRHIDQCRVTATACRV